MEQNLKCYMCDSQVKKLLAFTCSHYLCLLCTVKRFFKSNFHELQSKDIFEISCKCNQGTTNLPLDFIQETLKLSTQKKSDSSQKEFPFLESIGYAPMDVKSSDLYLCSSHEKKEKVMYCLNCKEGICQTCALNNNSHDDHRIENMKDSMEKLRQNVNCFPLKFKTWEEFSSDIDQIYSNYEARFQNEMGNTLDKFNKMIEFLQSLKEEYARNMEKIRNRTDMVFQIIKLVYSVFYADLNKIKGTFDITTMNYLDEIKWVFENMNISYDSKLNEQIDKIKEETEKIMSILKPCEISFSFTQMAKTFQKTQSCMEHTLGLTWLILLKDDRLASGSYDKTIRIWGEKELQYKQTQVLRGHIGAVGALIQLRDGRLVSGARDYTIRIWTEQHSIFICTQIMEDHTNWIISLIELKDGRVVSTSMDKSIKFWKESNGAFICIQNLEGLLEDDIHSITELNDGRFASGFEDNCFRIWKDEENNFNCLQKIMEHSSHVITVIQLNDGRLASGSYDNTIKIWGEGKDNTFICIQTLEGHSDYLRALLQLRDGRLVSGSVDESIKVWNEEQGHFVCNHTIEAHDDWIIGLIELKDGRLVSGSYDKTIRIWTERYS